MGWFRLALGVTAAALVFACTGGPDLPGTDGGSSSSSSSSSSTGGSSSGSSSGGGATILASSFDQSCTQDTDCSAVTEGSVCAACSCPNAAVAKSARTSFDTQKAQLAQSCPPQQAGCGVMCVAPQVYCDVDTCKFGTRPVVPDAGGD
jgi:hypothetical protein